MFKRILLTFLCLIGFFFIGIVIVAVYEVITESNIHEVSIVNNNGKKIGTAKLNETDVGVLFHVNVSGMNPNGEHAFHIHETADCWPQETFKNAGGHFNPMKRSHGMMHPEGSHAGDMPNLKPDENGDVDAKVLNQHVTLKLHPVNNRAPILDNDGSALVIHAMADDHMSQPSGAAGPRIACGEIK